ncbi:hypothetical protein LCGC14_2846860, partial [marine sediment metagenome]
MAFGGARAQQLVRPDGRRARLPHLLERALAVALFDGADLTRYLIRWVVASLELHYLDSGGAWVTFATGVDFFPSPSLFHTWKLVFDGSSNQYARVIVGPTASPLA